MRPACSIARNGPPGFTTRCEAKRSLSYSKSINRRAFAGIFPNSDYGRIQQSAFTQAASELGLRVVGNYSFGSEAEARSTVQQVAPLLR